MAVVFESKRILGELSFPERRKIKKSITDILEKNGFKPESKRFFGRSHVKGDLTARVKLKREPSPKGLLYTSPRNIVHVEIDAHGDKITKPNDYELGKVTREVVSYLDSTKEMYERTGRLPGFYGLGIFILFFGGGIVLSFNAIRINGNVVMGLFQTPYGLLGVALFIIGLVGAFFYFKKK